MQMIMDAISPEMLKIARETFMRGEKIVHSTPDQIDADCRARRDAAEEEADRRAFANRHERRKAAALAR